MRISFCIAPDRKELAYIERYLFSISTTFDEIDGRQAALLAWAHCTR